MDFRVYLNSSEEISKALIYEMYFQVDIMNLYSKATIKINDISTTLYNKIKTGQQFIIEFTLSNTESYTNYMRVISFQKKNQVTPTDLVENIEIKLVSSWYFDSTVGDAVYFGSYSEILNSIINKTTRSYFNGTDFTSTEDASRYRYRIGETEQAFLVRNMKYGIKGNLPVYLYTNAKGQLVLRGIKDFIRESATISISPDLSVQTNTEPSNISDYENLRVSSYNVAADIENAHSRMTSYITTSNFKLPEESSVPTSVALNNTENNNPQSEVNSPEIRIYSNWNRTPDDALATSIRSIFESNLSSYYLVAVIPSWTDILDLGTKIKVFLPYDPVSDSKTGKTNNLGEGEYFIKHISYIFKDNLYKTKLSLIQALY